MLSLLQHITPTRHVSVVGWVCVCVCLFRLHYMMRPPPLTSHLQMPESELDHEGCYHNGDGLDTEVELDSVDMDCLSDPHMERPPSRACSVCSRTSSHSSRRGGTTRRKNHSPQVVLCAFKHVMSVSILFLTISLTYGVWALFLGTCAPYIEVLDLAALNLSRFVFVLYLYVCYF